MTQPVSMTPWNGAVQSGEVQWLDVVLPITAAVTFNQYWQSMPVLAFTGALTQAQIDDFYGSTDEILAVKFDATAMGADMFGLLVNMGGQCSEVLMLEATCYSGTGGATAVKNVITATGLTDSSNTTQYVCTDEGNIGLRVLFGNTPDFDGLTSGTVHIRVAYKSK